MIDKPEIQDIITFETINDLAEWNLIGEQKATSINNDQRLHANWDNQNKGKMIVKECEELGRKEIV